MARDATCFCGSCLKKVRMFRPRTQRRGRRSCPHRHRTPTGLFETEVYVAGKQNFQGRDKEAETALEIQGRRCRDKISLGNSANSGLIAGFREISVITRMRGRPREQSHVERNQRLIEGAGRNGPIDRKRGLLHYPYLECADNSPVRHRSPGNPQTGERLKRLNDQRSKRTLP